VMLKKDVKLFLNLLVKIVEQKKSDAKETNCVWT